jgi:hypothetical protein
MGISLDRGYNPCRKANNKTSLMQVYGIGFALLFIIAQQL